MSEVKHYCIIRITNTMEATKCMIFSILLLSFQRLVLSDEPCETGWEPYKDEKCLKVFDAPGLLSYADAETYCKEQDNASLISIGFQEKQSFIEDFLKSKEVADNAWIGLKFTNNGTYEWSDGTDFFYNNWAPGSPKNESDHCVEIETEEAEFGKWSDALCTKRNLVLCEKLQLWSFSQLQATVINLMKNPFPVGFIYAQLPKEKPPSEIWSWMTWTEISSDYAGVFFRVVGGNSSSFGTVQQQTSPRIINAHQEFLHEAETESISINADNSLSSYLSVAQESCSSNAGCWRGIAFRQTGDEVRPLNMAIRIWKRTQ